MKFWNSGEVLVILIYFQQNLKKKFRDNFKKILGKFNKIEGNLAKIQEKMKNRRGSKEKIESIL